jgi:hypothetical protein
MSIVFTRNASGRKIGAADRLPASDKGFTVCWQLVVIIALLFSFCNVALFSCSSDHAHVLVNWRFIHY